LSKKVTSLFEQIGADRLRAIIDDFYLRAFADYIIGHFFFGKDHSKISTAQYHFTTRLLGGPEPYVGRSLTDIHGTLEIRAPHFDRRMVLLRQTAIESGLSEDIVHQWLGLEHNLRTTILKRI
jgi:hemoglobin